MHGDTGFPFVMGMRLHNVCINVNLCLYINACIMYLFISINILYNLYIFIEIVFKASNLLKCCAVLLHAILPKAWGAMCIAHSPSAKLIALAGSVTGRSIQITRTIGMQTL